MARPKGQRRAGFRNGKRERKPGHSCYIIRPDRWRTSEAWAWSRTSLFICGSTRAYSLSEGAIRIKDLAKLCVEQAMPAVAITDTNNLFGGMEFSSSMRQAGVQPIIGCQLSLAMTQAALRQGGGKGVAASGRDAVVVLVQNARGYANLLRLLAVAYGADAQSDPRVPLADLCAHAEGLIVLTGGPEGPIGRLLLEGRREAADGAGGAVTRGIRATASMSSCCDMGWRARRRPSRLCWRSRGKLVCRSSPPTTPTSRPRICTRRTTRCCASRRARTSPTPTAAG